MSMEIRRLAEIVDNRSFYGILDLFLQPCLFFKLCWAVVPQSYVELFFYIFLLGVTLSCPKGGIGWAVVLLNSSDR